MRSHTSSDFTGSAGVQSLKSSDYAGTAGVRSLKSSDHAGSAGVQSFTSSDYADLLLELKSLAEPEYRAFHLKLVPGLDDMLGVRLPQLRAIAKRLTKGDWRGYLACAQAGSYEEIQLQGMVLGAVKLEPCLLYTSAG